MKYGTEELELHVSARLAVRHECFADADSAAPPFETLAANVVGDLATAGFEEALRGKHLGLLVADGTREPTQETFLPVLANELRRARRITLFVCTGTHDPELPENRALALRLERILRETEIEASVLVHDARRSPLELLGTTRRGTRVEVNAAAMQCDLFLAIANMKNHYFAGYSNAVKYLVPGLASCETARGNHSLALEPESTFGRHPWHPSARRRSNPLAEDMVEAFEIATGARAHFALAAFGSAARIAWAGAGRTRAVTARGMEVVDRLAGLALPPARFLVVSPGGHPHDESLYTAQRALELSRAAVRDGGEVLFLARCPNGIGPPAARENFFEPLSRPLDLVCRRPLGEYVMYSHKSYKFGHYLSGLEAVHMLSDLSPEDVARIHIRPAASAQSVLDDWSARAERGDAVTFLDDASRFAVHAAR